MIEVLEKTKLLDKFLSNKLDGLVFSTNIENKINTDLSKRLFEKFPENFNLLENSNNQLGKVSYFKTENGIVYSIVDHSIKGIGRRTNYEAFYSGLEEIESLCFSKKKNFRLGIPFNVSYKSEKSDWQITSAIINYVFEDSNVNAIICKPD